MLQCNTIKYQAANQFLLYEEKMLKHEGLWSAKAHRLSRISYGLLGYVLYKLYIVVFLQGNIQLRSIKLV